MANESWMTLIAMCLAPAVILFIVAGLVSIAKHIKASKLSSNEEVDHEL